MLTDWNIFTKRQAFLFVEESGFFSLTLAPTTHSRKSSDAQLIFPFSMEVGSLTIPFIRCGVREMHTSFSLWPQPYFPSSGLKKTNKPSIFKFSEECFPSSWFSNAFKWKKKNWKQAAVWVICKLSEITVFLLHRLSDWQCLPPDSQTAGIGQDDVARNCSSFFFF